MASSAISVTVPSGGGNFVVNAEDVLMYKAESASTARLYYAASDGSPVQEKVVNAVAANLSGYFNDGVTTITGALDGATYYVSNNKIVIQSQTDKFIDLNWSGSKRRLKYA